MFIVLIVAQLIDSPFLNVVFINFRHFYRVVILSLIKIKFLLKRIWQVTLAGKMGENKTNTGKVANDNLFIL